MNTHTIRARERDASSSLFSKYTFLRSAKPSLGSSIRVVKHPAIQRLFKQDES